MKPLERSQKDRALGCLFGLAIGDALGSTLEFTIRDCHPPVLDLIGGGPFNLAPGEWTDDTSMALCLADSLIACRGLDTDDLMQRFIRWWRTGENSVNGVCFDIGNTTREALTRYEGAGVLAGDGRSDDSQAGNGSLMRLAPIALYAATDVAKAIELAFAQSKTTHAAETAHDACALFVAMLVEAIMGADKETVIKARHFVGRPEIAAIAAGSWRTKNRDEISSSGYVVHTLEAALWCVGNAAGFEDAVILAANLGGDADTVAAVTGQLAGALWGLKAISRKWRAKIAMADHIMALATSLVGHHADAGGINGDRLA